MRSVKQGMRKRVKLFGKAIPVWILIAVVCAGAAVAGYSVWSHTYWTTVTEPIEVTAIDSWVGGSIPPETIEPGLGTVFALVEIHNGGGFSHNVTVAWGQLGSEEDKNNGTGIVTYATAYYIDADGKMLDDIFRVVYSGTETFKIYTDGHDTADGKSSYVRVQVNVMVYEDAPPGAINVPVEVFRG